MNLSEKIFVTNVSILRENYHELARFLMHIINI